MWGEEVDIYREDREIAGGTWQRHKDTGSRKVERDNERRWELPGVGVGLEWTTSQSSPGALFTYADRCCCTSSVMPTTTCWVSTPPSASPSAQGAAAAMDSASLQGCVPVSQAGGALTAACRSAQPTVVAMAPVPR